MSPECYAHMTHMLLSVAGGKLVACLEVCKTRYSSPRSLLKLHQGRLQFRFNLLICIGRDKDSNGRNAAKIA